MRFVAVFFVFFVFLNYSIFPMDATPHFKHTPVADDDGEDDTDSASLPLAPSVKGMGGGDGGSECLEGLPSGVVSISPEEGAMQASTYVRSHVDPLSRDFDGLVDSFLQQINGSLLVEFDPMHPDIASEVMMSQRNVATTLQGELPSKALEIKEYVRALFLREAERLMPSGVVEGSTVSDGEEPVASDFGRPPAIKTPIVSETKRRLISQLQAAKPSVMGSLQAYFENLTQQSENEFSRKTRSTAGCGFGWGALEETAFMKVIYGKVVEEMRVHFAVVLDRISAEWDEAIGALTRRDEPY